MFPCGCDIVTAATVPAASFIEVVAAATAGRAFSCLHKIVERLVDLAISNCKDFISIWRLEW